MAVHYTDDQITLHHGQALDVLRTMPAGSVDCVVTSPPYYGLRDYGSDGQLGAESTMVEYLTRLVEILNEAGRVLAADGTLWLNLGDSYATSAAGPRTNHGNLTGRPNTATTPQGMGGKRDLPQKNLLGVPWRVAFALQDSGWILRSDVIWRKPNAMPESVKDRLSGTHEHVFLLAKQPRYWFDLDPIRQPHAESTIAAATRARPPYTAPGQTPNLKTRTMADAGANPGDVWDISTSPFSDAHFAVMPPALAERCILAGCRSGGTVLDPFAGSGTTGMVALKHGRRFVGIDLNAEYLDLALRTRLAQSALIDEVG